MLKYFRPNVKTNNKTKIKQISHDPCVASLYIFLKFETKVSQIDFSSTHWLFNHGGPYHIESKSMDWFLYDKDLLYERVNPLHAIDLFLYRLKRSGFLMFSGGIEKTSGSGHKKYYFTYGHLPIFKPKPLHYNHDLVRMSLYHVLFSVLSPF